MNKSFCDICGKEIEEAKNILYYNINGHTFNPDISDGWDYKFFNSKDLCKTCQKDKKVLYSIVDEFLSLVNKKNRDYELKINYINKRCFK